VDVAGSPAIGTDAGVFLGKPAGVLIESDLAKALANAEFLIDFTRPEGTLKHLDYCAAHGIKMIIGTTGFDDAGKAAIAAAGKQTAIVFAPNMSVGVNVTLKLLEMAARVSPKAMTSKSLKHITGIKLMRLPVLRSKWVRSLLTR
jgi:4-hydroxy-tetrahydrodipicolinate reductase